MTEQHDDLELIDLSSATTPAAADRRAGTRAGRRGHARPRGRRRRTWWLWGVALVIGALGLWAVLAYSQLQGVRGDLFTARDQLDQAVSAVREGNFQAADTLLADSHDLFASVPDRVRGPMVAPALLVPGMRETLAAVADIATGAEVVSGAGGEVLDVLGDGDGGLGALTPEEGRIPVDAFASLAAVLQEAGADIVDAEALVSEVPREGIDTAVRDARDAFLDQIGPVAEQVDDVSRIAGLLPDLFGADGPRTYMVVAANPTEARGSGGFFGAFTILEADDGELSFSAVRPTQDLQEIPRGEIPWPDPSLEERYDLYGGSGFLVNLNMTPDFPAAATAIENYYEAATGERLDGVVAVNPFAFEALLRIAGPVDVPGYGQVGADEVVDFVAHDAYSVILDPEERKRLIGLVATAALQGFLGNPGGTSAPDVVAALGDMVARESIMVHAADPQVQAALAEVGIDGALGRDGEGDFLGVFLNSGAYYKVDYWLERYLHYDVVLGPDGQAAGTLSTGFVNGAPTTGEVEYMVGVGLPPLAVADVLSYISVYCAPGCEFHEVPDAGFDDLVTEEGIELDHGVTSTWMRLPAGRSRVLVWSYTTPGAWEARGADRVYRLHYGHQTVIQPTQLRVRVHVPDGFAPATLPDGATVADGVVTIETATETDLDFELVFSPSG